MKTQIPRTKTQRVAQLAKAGCRGHKNFGVDVEPNWKSFFGVGHQTQVSCAARTACLNGKPCYPLTKILSPVTLAPTHSLVVPMPSSIRSHRVRRTTKNSPSAIQPSSRTSTNCWRPATRPQTMSKRCCVSSCSHAGAGGLASQKRGAQHKKLVQAVQSQNSGPTLVRYQCQFSCATHPSCSNRGRPRF
jgi:hypothetical protein